MSNKRTLSTKLCLDTLQVRNAHVMDTFLQQNREGVDLADPSGAILAKQFANGHFTFTKAHTQESWTQPYQFVDLATVDSEVIKVSYKVCVEMKIKNNCGLSSQSRALSMPVSILWPRDQLPVSRKADLVSD